ncbi:unnamed protein product [Spirodela intermedia]|uniref:Uncharacterized protein n=1 Tax=Spirodela intermedia TaxID=51605 RepID=A0A7I8JQW2_SPIIN|nr:unnamed protein product [Spirodela intermedia]CAA6671822.1 unnamed protein product [Spirodela intermedia]
MRPAAAARWLLVALAVMMTSAPVAESAVASIDLGSEWLKVAVVNLKPGQPPISVAINEIGGQRLVGEEAAGIAARYPEKVYSSVRDMVGKPHGCVRGKVEAAYQSFDLVEDSRGAAGIRTDDGNATVYSTEELLAMILAYAKNLAESQAKVPVLDAVITVPAFFGQAERKAVMQAAQLAGIKVLGLINEHAGAALQYGIDKDFSNESRHVIFYDMGSGSTYAALVYFSSYKAKEYGKTISVNQFQVKDVRWNTELGGMTMESRLVEHFADEFNKKLGNSFDVRKSPKAMAKLKKQVKRTKEILSANTAAPISVESLYDDHDFKSTITREKFEELCSDIMEQAVVPVKEVLEHSGLKLDEIDAVELIGGATRVPKLQAKLQEFLGKKELGKHLDADEAIVLGAALHARISDDGSSYGFVIQLDGPDLSEDETSEQSLVPRMKKLLARPSSHKHSKDFEVHFGEKTDLLPRGVSSHKLHSMGVSGLTRCKYSDQESVSPINRQICTISLSRSGVISLDRAEAVIEYLSGSRFQEEFDSGKPTVSELKSDCNIMQKTQPIVEVSMEKKLKKRTFRVPLKIMDKTAGPEVVLSTESYSEAKIRLEMLDRKDSERRRTAELKNNLEGYIYSTKEGLKPPMDETSELEKVSTDRERKSFAERLEEVQEWLYMDGEDAPADEFKDRLNSLKAIGPNYSSELSSRPVACEHARSYLSEIPKENKPWLPKSRVDEVRSEAERLGSWLDVKESLQKATPASVTPAFSSSEVYEKTQSLQSKVAGVNRIPKPRPKIEKPAAKEESQKEQQQQQQQQQQHQHQQQSADASEDSKPEAAETRLVLARRVRRPTMSFD